MVFDSVGVGECDGGWKMKGAGDEVLMGVSLFNVPVSWFGVI